MMQANRRWSPRYSARSEVSALLGGEGGHQNEGKAVDVSASGAYLSNSPIPGHTARVEFCIKNPGNGADHTIDRNCSLLAGREGASGGCAVRFHRPLSGAELAGVAAVPSGTGSLDLARRDYREVHEEIRAIQRCRNNIFLGTLAAIATWITGAVGMALSHPLGGADQVGQAIWVLVGASVPYFLLTVAILATIEKARAINVREGFLCALTDFIRHDAAPPNYLGWPQLRCNRAECRARHDAGLCPTSPKYCWETERGKHEGVNRSKHVVSNVLDSFTAFSSLVYSMLYLVTAGTLLIASLMLLPRTPSWTTYLVPVTIGVIGALLGLALATQLRSVRKGKHSLASHYFCWRAALRSCSLIEGASTT